MNTAPYNFYCPKCNALLSEKGEVVLSTQRTNGQVGQIRLAASIGNYEYRHTPEVRFQPGEVVNFLCTSCKSDLNSSEYKNYALLKMKVDASIEFEVLFSREAGVKKTYVITEDGIETYSGEGPDLKAG